MWDAGRGGAARRRSATASYGLKEGDGAFYGPKIDFQVDRRDGPLVAARHLPARLLRSPSASTSSYTNADDQEERPVMIHRADHRVDRALPRDPDRERRRRLPALAGARAGAGAADRRPPRPLRRVGAGAPARLRPAGRGSTPAPSRWGGASATASSPRSRTCWSSATRRRRRAPRPSRARRGGRPGRACARGAGRAPARRGEERVKVRAHQLGGRPELPDHRGARRPGVRLAGGLRRDRRSRPS